MGINKVQYGNTTLIDLTSDTVTADKLMQGYTAHDRSGTLITGTATGGGGSGGNVWQDAQGYVHLDDEGGSSGQYAWLGEDAEKVGVVINKVINLKNDTDYDNWTASTTATTLIAASTDPDYTLNANIAGYDYCFITKGFIEPVYLSGTPLTYTTKRVCQYHLQYFYGYPSYTTTADVQADFASTFTGLNSATVGFVQYYYNSAGSVVSRSATQCGCLYMSTYPTIQGGGVSDGIVSITYKLPAFNAKCDSSRFSTERKAQVDSENTNYNLTVELYRVPHGKGLMSHLISEMCEALNA